MARPKFVSRQTIHLIRELYSADECTQQKLADRFGLSQSTICKIVNNYIHRNDTDLTVSGEASVKVGYKHGNKKSRR
jgi:DNA-binding XRE family transcriptional regulator